MRKIFAEQGKFTTVPNYVFDTLMPRLPASAFKVLCLILRQTVGWHEEQTQVSYQAIRRGTGLNSNTTIAAALKILLGESTEIDFGGQHLITRASEGGWETITYRLNFDFDADAVPAIGSKNEPSLSPENEPSARPASPENEPSVGSKNGQPPYIERKNKYIAPATEKKATRKTGSRRGTSLPNCRIETDVLCPADLSLTPELQAWAERRLPPATLARMSGLIEYFVRDNREVHQTRLRDRKAWLARFQNFLQSCGERDAARSGPSSGAEASTDYSASFDDLVRMGVIDPSVVVPTPVQPATAGASMATEQPSNPKHTF